MKYLLDTHVFVWWDMDASQLSPSVDRILRDGTHTLLLSTTSLWEIQIKLQLGKLQLGAPLPVIIEQQIKNGFMLLPIVSQHVLELDKLPLHHRDPFDRMLIAQARFEQAILLTNDHLVRQYQVSVLW
jgi:PIN domain nuclease of toxin-antitoxin system